jgi:hypothetical protein
MFKISAIGPKGYTSMNRLTASEALRKAKALIAAGFGNVRISDRTGRLHSPSAFERFFVKQDRSNANRTQGSEATQ